MPLLMTLASAVSVVGLNFFVHPACMTPIYFLIVDDPKGERTQANFFFLCEQLQDQDQCQDLFNQQNLGHLHKVPWLMNGTLTRCDNVRPVCTGQGAIGLPKVHALTGQARSECGAHPGQGALKVWAENGGRAIGFDVAGLYRDPFAALT